MPTTPKIDWVLLCRQRRSPLTGGTTFDVVGQGFDFYERTPTISTCEMGTTAVVARPYLWYRNVHVSNLESVTLVDYQVLIEFDSKTMVAAGQLRR